MLKWFSKRHPSKKTAEKEKMTAVSPGNTRGKQAFVRNEEGFYLPQPADVLLAGPQRQNWLQQISPVVALPDRQYRELCLTPLKMLSERLQCVPAAKNGRYAGEGGLLDLTLTTTAYCVRMSQKDMLPRGLPSEEQSRQFSAWNVCVFYTGLFYWLPLTAKFEGQLNNQSPWQPGISTPPEPFRFRFRDPVPDTAHIRQTTGAMTAFRLLPENAVQWLAGYPLALQSLAEVLTGQAASDNDLLSILNDALGAFPAGSLPALSPPVHLLPETAGRQGLQSTEPQSPAESSSGDTTPVMSLQPSGGEAAHTLVASDNTGFSVDNAEGSEPEHRQQNTQDVAQADSATSAPDKLVPPSEDLMYALELSGLVPTELSGIRDTPKNNDEETLLPPNDLSHIAVPVLVPDVQAGDAQYTEAEGALFWQWLKEGLLNGRIENNTPAAKVHSVMGYLFCQSPAVFFQYAQEQHKNTDEVNHIIASFELLKFHRVIQRTTRPTGHFRARIYGSELNPLTEHEKLIKWPHKKISGYMIKGSRIFGMNMPDESPFIRIVGN